MVEIPAKDSAISDDDGKDSFGQLVSSLAKGSIAEPLYTSEYPADAWLEHIR